MRLHFTKVWTAIALIAIATTGCEKDDAPTDDTAEQQEILEANSIAEFSTDADVQLGVTLDEEGPSSSSIQGLEKNLCASVGIQGTVGTYPITYTLDFGTGCTGPRGLTRSGILQITLTDYIFHPGAIMTIERQNYAINGRALGGTITYTNNSTSAAPDWNRTVANGSLTTLGGRTYTFTSDRDIRISSGAFNGVLADNIYEMHEGTRTVNRPNGSSLTVTVTSSLLRPHTCEHITQGSISLLGTILDGTLDYGSGNCDDQAVYTHSNGNTRNITLM